MVSLSRRILTRLVACLALCSGLFSAGAAQAAEGNFPQMFFDATGISAKLAPQGGNAFAAAQTVSGPYGGSYSIDVGQWSGNSGTIAVTYNNFKLPNGWGYNGSWTYTGSVASNGILTGTLAGTWVISGLNLGAGATDLSYNMKAVFANGNATLTMTYTMPTMVISGYTIPGSTQTATLTFKQQDMMGVLL